MLTSNQISHIHSPPKAVLEQSETASPLHDLKHLALAFNRLSTWADMDMLQRWVPQLESLTLAGNPLIDGESMSVGSRPPSASTFLVPPIYVTSLILISSIALFPWTAHRSTDVINRTWANIVISGAMQYIRSSPHELRTRVGHCKDPIAEVP